MVHQEVTLMNANEPTPVVAYAARSAKATENEETHQQLAAIRARLAQEDGRDLIATYSEDARSGFKGDRGPELEAAMAHAVELTRDHATVELWVWASNRLARGSGLKGEARSVLEVFAYLRRSGVTLRSVSDDQFVISPMLIGFAAEQANKYSADLSANVMRGKDAQWERGDWIGGPIPDGYLSDGAKGLEIDPEREPVMRRLWALALDGYAPAPLARILNVERLRTRAGRAWSRRRVQDTLTNAVYAGQLVRWRATPREERKPASWPAYVTPEEFEAVAKATAERDQSSDGRAAAGGRPSRRYLLATLARCGRCGGSMFARTSTYRRKDGTRARDYQCEHYAASTGLCDFKVSAELMDAAVLEHLPRYVAAAERWLAELGDDREGARDRAQALVDAAARRLRDADTRVESLGDRFEAEPDEARADALLDRLVRARADRDKVERELQSAQAEADAVRAALDGDALHGALRSLTDTLITGPSADVAAFNRRLRDHFDGFVIVPEGGPPVPLWKVQVPTQIEQPRMPREPLSGLLARRAEELNLDLSRTPQGSHR
jgi:DNA invertase Pin-like site-specific DNA recombinase